MVSGGRLTVVWSRGPFRTARSFERDAIRRILVLAPRDWLALDAGRQRVELSRLGTRSERAEVAAELRTELALSESDRGEPQIPDRWEEIITPEVERALVPNPGVRRAQARVAAALTVASAAVTFLIARGIVEDPRMLGPALIAVAVTCALATGAVWLSRGRWEWRIGHGRLTLRRRYGASAMDVFEARRLLLDSSTDSDGDVWYALYALGDLDDAAPRSAMGWHPPHPRNSRTIVRLMNDSSTVRDLGEWLSRETGIGLEDRTTPEAQAADLAKLRDMLEHSGTMGRWAARMMDRMAGQGRDVP